MEYKEFKKILCEKMQDINIILSEMQVEQFFKYMNLLLEWNEKINLTAITDENEIILKHFVDSLTICKYLENKNSLIDVGTGAGFPGIPVKIVRPDLKIVLLDSLNKRVKFLNDVIEKLDLKNIVALHGRAEEVARKPEYREQFDIATSRAVANLSVLLEYLVPFVKVGERCICMKGAEIEEELNSAGKAMMVLGAKIDKVDDFWLPGSDMRRNLVILKKMKETSGKYPRKAGVPAKDPIG